MLAETDVSGLVQTQLAYEPFGSTTGTGAPTTTAFQFTGRERDTDTLYFYRARFYSATADRFLSEDPIEFSGGLNLYAYVADSPTNLIDPTGECSCSVRVRCRPVDDQRARKVSAQHCYMVVKDKNGSYSTLTGGPVDGGPTGKTLHAWNIPGDPAPGNSFTDQTVYFREGSSMCGSVDCLKARVDEVNGLNLPYLYVTLNSNTFVSYATLRCGLFVVLPINAYGR